MPAPHRRSGGESLAKKIDTNVSKRAMDDRDNLVASRTRQDKKWASLSSVLEQRAEQARTEYGRASRLSHFADEVKQGRAKPPIVAVAPKRDRREAMEAEVNQQNSAAAFRRVLDTPCPAHGVSPGEPCWWPIALCGERIQRAGFNGVVVTRGRR